MSKAETDVQVMERLAEMVERDGKEISRQELEQNERPLNSLGYAFRVAAKSK